MKKILALLLCLLLTALCLAACAEGSGSVPPFVSSQAQDAPAPTAASEAVSEENHTHVNYKGLTEANFTVEDMAAAEGREADFTFDSNGSTAYAYNDVVLDDLTFTQVQYFYAETGNRISCTYSADLGLEEVYARCQEAMTAIYGEPTQSGENQIWRDGHTRNQVTLTMLNETTVQLAFYFSAT